MIEHEPEETQQESKKEFDENTFLRRSQQSINLNSGGNEKNNIRINLTLLIEYNRVGGYVIEWPWAKTRRPSK